MACGNGKITRDYLASAPTPAAAEANAMFSASSTHKASAPPSPKVIRLPPAPTTQSTEKWAPKDGQMFYSTSRLGKRPNSGTIEYFIGADGESDLLAGQAHPRHPQREEEDGHIEGHRSNAVGGRALREARPRRRPAGQ